MAGGMGGMGGAAVRPQRSANLGESQLALRDQARQRGGQSYAYKSEGLAESSGGVPPEGQCRPGAPGAGRRP